MNTVDQQPRIAVAAEQSAFSVWLGRALKSCHDDAINEPIPAELLALLPPPKQR